MANEYLNGHFYEIESDQKDLTLLLEEFNLAHSIDRNAGLCINDYLVIRTGDLTSVCVAWKCKSSKCDWTFDDSNEP